MIRRLTILLALAGCAPSPSVVAAPERPMRIVSLDYCADQYVLKLVPRERIAAVSPDGAAEFSYMRAAAVGVPQVRPSAEDVLALKPDLVVRSYGGGANAADLFARAGVPVLQLGYADDFAGVRRVLIDAATGLGERAKGEAMARDIDRRLAAIDKGERRNALYVTPGGVTGGQGTMIDALFDAAGLGNFQTAPGWGSLPLERLAHERPDIVATAFFDTRWNRADPWSAAGHPVLRDAIAGKPRATLSGAWTACGGWFLVDAVEALAKAAR